MLSSLAVWSFPSQLSEALHGWLNPSCGPHQQVVKIQHEEMQDKHETVQGQLEYHRAHCAKLQTENKGLRQDAEARRAEIQLLERELIRPALTATPCTVSPRGSGSNLCRKSREPGGPNGSETLVVSPC